jgi:hypothetical protein
MTDQIGRLDDAARRFACTAHYLITFQSQLAAQC